MIYISLLIACLLSLPASAGTIVGTVRAQGKEGADQDTAANKYTARKWKFVEKVDYAAMRDFVVYLDHVFPDKPVPPSKPVQVVTQKDATFKPHVLPVLVGTTVEWPNNDEIYHNVFSDSEARKFDLGLYKEEIKQVLFDKPGRVDVFCSIHTRMHCVVLVLENPFFATTNAKGAYKITNVPPGKYKLKAWHQRLPADIQEIVVPPDGEVKVDFVLSVKGLPKL